MIQKKYATHSIKETVQIGIRIGKCLKGGEVFELISDLGGGKTAFTRGLVSGFGSEDPVASPSFTIGNVYKAPEKKEFHHFDFYRLEDVGIVKNELAEVLGDPEIVVAVEWGEAVHDVLPKDRITVNIKATSENERLFTFSYPKDLDYLFANIPKGVS